MRRYNSKATIINYGSPWQNLAATIVYSAVMDDDRAFFQSEWGAYILESLGIHGDPIAIYERYRRCLHGKR